jgi:cytochrome c peroxidase
VIDGPFVGDGRASPLKSAFVHGFELAPEERASLLAFLESLTDEAFLEDPASPTPSRAVELCNLRGRP